LFFSFVSGDARCSPSPGSRRACYNLKLPLQSIEQQVAWGQGAWTRVEKAPHISEAGEPVHHSQAEQSRGSGGNKAAGES